MKLFTKLAALALLAAVAPSAAAASKASSQSSGISKEDSKMWATYEPCEKDARPNDDCVEKEETEEICDNDTNPHLPRCNVLTTCTWICPGSNQDNNNNNKGNTKDARDSCQDFDIENCDDCGEYCDEILDPPYGARCNGHSDGSGMASCRCSAGPKDDRTSVFFCTDQEEEVEMELGATSSLRKLADVLAGIF